MVNNPKAYIKIKLLEKAYSLISTRAYTQKKLTYKLKAYLYKLPKKTKLDIKLEDAEIKSIILEVITELENQQLLDDLKYAIDFVEELIRKMYGKFYIINKLKERGISNGYIETAFNTNNFDEISIIRDYISTHPHKVNLQDKQKSVRHLTSRGFQYNNIDTVLQEYSLN